MNTVTGFLKVMALGAGVVGIAYGQAPEVGLVSMLSGKVSYQSEAAQAGKPQAFMKIRQGDRFTLPAGAKLRVVYFQGGRQESWTGPAAFRAGSQQSEASNGQPVAVTTLHSAVQQKIAQVPELIQIAKLGRLAGVAVRNWGKAPRLTAEQQAEVDAAKDTYGKLRARSSADDITPELYLYSVLEDYLLYDDMKPVVEEMSKRQPSSIEVQELASWVTSKTQ